MVESVIRRHLSSPMTIKPSWCLALAALAGCEGKPPFLAAVDSKQLMTTVLEPAAEQYWDAVGTVDDSTGSRSYGPTSAEDWAAVRNSAVVIAESGNLLMIDGRAKDRGQWMTMARDLVEAGQRAIEAATKQDTALVFEAGGVVYEACTRCHAAYAVQLVRPNADPR